MYRLVLLLLCHTAAPAPQTMTDSDITYVKVQPPIEAPTASRHYRESRIENLPLTIPGKTSLESKNDDENRTSNDTVPQSNFTSDLTLPESSNISESVALPDVNEKEAEKATELPENESERTSEETPETTTISKLEVEKKTDSTEKEELLEAHGSDLSDTIPLESYQSERRGRTYDSGETTDIFEEITERFEDITQAPLVSPRTKPPPKFSKLSYIPKPQGFVSFAKNSIEKSPLRRFRSHCRCEKIWNCPKLQISVHRCPNEYFLCCF